MSGEKLSNKNSSIKTDFKSGKEAEKEIVNEFDYVMAQACF